MDKNDRQRQAEEMANKYCDENFATQHHDEYWENKSSYLKGWTDADSTPAPSEVGDEEADIPRIDPKEIRHWWIQKPTRHNCPLEMHGAVFEEYEPTRREQNCEWVKVYSADDLHAKIGINISRYVNVATALAHARRTQNAEVERLKNDVKRYSEMSLQYMSQIQELRSLLERAKGFADFVFGYNTTNGINPKYELEWLSDYEKLMGKKES